MTPEVFSTNIVKPTLAYMATSLAIPVTDAARVLLMTIAGQESLWKERRQIGGPARGFWQFERNGGVAEIFSKCSKQLSVVCADEDIPFNMDVVFEAMAWHDRLSCVMARLLLWQDPAALPAVGDKQAAWQYYLRNWRPGAPHRATWDGLYDRSL